MKLGPWICLAFLGCQGASDEKNSMPYTVVQGDTLFLIAQRHGTTVDALRLANDLHGDLIEVGQVLHLPDGSTPSAKQHATAHKQAPRKPQSSK